MKMALAVAVCLIVSLTFAAAQQPSNQQKEKPGGSEATCPMHEAHMRGTAPSKDMNERGKEGMGFSQTATTHHFLIKPDSGVIQVEVNDPADTSNRTHIREHLAYIAEAFANGDFEIPMFVHDTVPPGVPEMKRLREKIRYSFEETSNGGRVIIATNDKESLDAIHKFLRFQIQEHKTGDSTQAP